MADKVIEVRWLKCLLVQGDLRDILLLSCKHELSFLLGLPVRVPRSTLLFLELFDTVAVSKRVQGVFAAGGGG